MINRKLCIITILWVAIMLSAWLNAAVITVGNGANPSLSAAVHQARAGDTVLVIPGTYKEAAIIIDKPLTLLGQNHPVIDGMNKGHILDIRADSVTVKGFHLRNVQQSYTKDFAAIHLFKCSHFVIEDNVLRNSFFGILIERSKRGYVRNNDILGEAVTEQSSGNGIHGWHSSFLFIENNHVERMRDGIYFEFVKNSVIKGNKSRHNVRYGLHFMFSNDDRYEANTFEKNGAGVAVMFSNRISMIKNRFRLNWGSASYGLLLKEIYDATIKDNLFYKNTIGVNADGANRIEFSGNRFDNNGWAIRFLGACYGNKIIGNNFVYNALDISYTGSINGNVFDRNFWSKYSGYDLDKNGIGDVPYRPVKLFSYIVHKTPETIILLRSLFVDIINFSEKVSPILTPDNLKDNQPLMKPVTENAES
ncbi:MAG: nitrous oxide reductase family maturation protein NosD [Calditrichaeota bacterium]|nr:MAG: nitrous oxide reductase family maturation protein NosD [Calditrichota bacterium]